jgi:hypothetical protein
MSNQVLRLNKTINHENIYLFYRFFYKVGPIFQIEK